MLLGADELLHGGAGPLEYGSQGVVRARVAFAGEGGAARELVVRLGTDSGWHVNAREPLQELLIPTELALAAERGEAFELSGVRYPEPELVTLGFQEEPLRVYQGDVEIRARLLAGAAPVPAIAPLRLRVQACDDEKCLEPEDLLLELPVHPSADAAGAGPGGALLFGVSRLPVSASGVAAGLAALALLAALAVATRLRRRPSEGR